MIITYNTKKEVLVILVLVGRDLSAIIPARSKTMMTAKIAKTTIMQEYEYTHVVINDEILNLRR